MADDIVTQLRIQAEVVNGKYYHTISGGLHLEAAYEIERLRAELQHSALQTNVMRNIATAPYGDAAEQTERLRKERDYWRNMAEAYAAEVRSFTRKTLFLEYEREREQRINGTSDD